MKRHIVLLAAAAALTFAGCQKDPLEHLSWEESRIYITNYDTAVNFTQFHTYSIADSIAVITNNESYKQLDAVDIAFKNAVKKYMDNYGYVQVAKTESPDLGININRIIRTSTGFFSYPDYWGYYGGYWDPFYWGFPGYGYYGAPYFFGVYQIREGMLSIDMLDLKNASQNNRIDIIWNGLIRGEGIFDANTADSQVKALFEQSPYLKIN